MPSRAASAEDDREVYEPLRRRGKTPLKSGKIDPKVVPGLAEIRRAIPAHLFRPSLLRSLYYAVQDMAIALSMMYAVYTWYDAIPSIVWPLYWFAEGTTMWAIFVVGHDCGHGGFSKFPLINHTIGTLLHTFILVPYFMWKLSHNHHHKSTGNIDTDEIFYPSRASDLNKEGGPYYLARHGYFGLGLSWFAYLVVGYRPRPVSHLNPFEPMYAKHQIGVWTSLIAWVSWLAFTVYQCTLLGFVKVAVLYYMPLFVFASWLVLVTFLHHQDEDVNWYTNKNWDYVRGNLGSVDRDYGLLHFFTHSIGTHQVHHLFANIPHYNLVEATYHFRKAFPHLVCVKEHESILSAFARNFNNFAAQHHTLPDNVEMFSYVDSSKLAKAKKQQ